MTPPERLVALMTAAGMAPKEIARQIPSLSTRRVNQILASPLAKVLVDQLAKQITEEGVRSVADRLAADAPKNLDFIIDVRDGKFDGTEPDDMNHRKWAAGALLDRQAPKRTESTNENTLRIVVEGPEREYIEGVCEEIGEPLARPQLPAPALDTGPVALYEPQDLDTLLEKYTDDA